MTSRNNITRLIRLLILFVLAFAFISQHNRSLAAQLHLSWSDNSDNEEGFEIERSTSATDFVHIAIVGANVSSFVDSSLATGETYCYRVRAFDAAIFSHFSNIGCATTPVAVMVSLFGSGMGTVVSNPAGIDCGNDCIEQYPRGTIVTLIPNPAEGSAFAGWNGGCAGTAICMFNADTDVSITALFDNLNP